MKCIFCLTVVSLVLLISCEQKNVDYTITKFEPLDSVSFNKDLKMLGERLFFDTKLSVNNTVSCATCHIPALAFTDGKKMSRGIHNRNTKRNSPTLFTVKHQDKFMWDGGVKTLELQALVPLQDTNEMGSRISELIPELQKEKWYDSMSVRLYNRPFDMYTLTRALSYYQQSLYREESVFDDWFARRDAVEDGIERGYKLFSERLNCIACHSGKTFTNSSMQNNGLYTEYSDVGHYLISGDSADIGKFKVPTLRNVEITAPYMHDGSLETLEEVINHYIAGGKNHPNKSMLIKPFSLSEEEKKDLIAFLKSLSDKDLKKNWLRVFN